MALVKICGINDTQGLDAAVAHGADLLGFVFFPPSPRAVTPAEAGALAARLGAGGPERVALVVDADDALLEAVVAGLRPDVLQLHGAETPARCAAVKARFGLPVMKALGIAEAADLALLADFAPVVDRFLLDAKPPADATLPGGNAATFDWRLLAGQPIPRPWLLAGGLTADNVAEALRISGAPGVDVSSGVERSRGLKDAGRIAAFIAAAKAAR